MLRISKLTDYGTPIPDPLAGHPDRLHSAAGLAEALGLGLPTVSKVLKTLGRHELVSSQRGAHGGLRAPPVRPTESPWRRDRRARMSRPSAHWRQPSSGVRDRTDCRIRENWMRINTVVRQALQAVNIADMVHPVHGAAFPPRPPPNTACMAPRAAPRLLPPRARVTNRRSDDERPTSAPADPSSPPSPPRPPGDAIGAFLEQDYAAGFETTLDTDTVPKGLSEDVIRDDLRTQGWAEPNGCSTGASRPTVTG